MIDPQINYVNAYIINNVIQTNVYFIDSLFRWLLSDYVKVR